PDWVLTAGTLTRCGALDLAEGWATRGLADAKAAGLIYKHSGAHWALGYVARSRGRLAEAAASFEIALRGAREYGAVMGIHGVLTGLIEVQTERGQFEAAESLLAEAGLEFELPPAIFTRGEFLVARAALRLAQGDAEAALTDLAAAAADARKRADLGPGATMWRSASALAHLRLGERDRARRLAAEELARARRFGAPETLGIALQAAALAEGGERELELLREAIALLADSPHRLEHARSLVALGSALRRSGERAAARGPLKDGLETARSCGAVPLVERAYEELRATGARPRKILYTGVESLTPSEGRVARLAAAGRTNRQIAEELFVTTKTVESHLGSAYRKLEIDSRGELTVALGDADPGLSA
ncbi:MAG: helix-turn-helix transcriptional regulator, partial [Solirubrobacterales bacterium]